MSRAPASAARSAPATVAASASLNVALCSPWTMAARIDGNTAVLRNDEGREHNGNLTPNHHRELLGTPAPYFPPQENPRPTDMPKPLTLIAGAPGWTKP